MEKYVFSVSVSHQESVVIILIEELKCASDFHSIRVNSLLVTLDCGGWSESLNVVNSDE